MSSAIVLEIWQECLSEEAVNVGLVQQSLFSWNSRSSLSLIVCQGIFGILIFFIEIFKLSFNLIPPSRSHRCWTKESSLHWKAVTAALHFAMQGGLSLRNFFLCDFVLTWLENLHHFSNLRDLFGLTWSYLDKLCPHFCKRQAESDITVSPSVTCMDWLRWWYKHAADVVSSSTALAFVTKNEWEM